MNTKLYIWGRLSHPNKLLIFEYMIDDCRELQALKIFKSKHAKGLKWRMPTFTEWCDIRQILKDETDLDQHPEEYDADFGLKMPEWAEFYSLEECQSVWYYFDLKEEAG